MSAGPAITAIGLAMFARIGHSGDYLTEVLPAVMIYGLGLAITVAPLTSTVLAAVPASHAGMASAANNTIARASSLIAIAVLPAAAGLGGTAYLDPARFSPGVRPCVPHLRGPVPGRRCACGDHHTRPRPGSRPGSGAVAVLPPGRSAGARDHAPTRAKTRQSRGITRLDDVGIPGARQDSERAIGLLLCTRNADQ